jgi:hypothetical protein
MHSDLVGRIAYWIKGRFAAARLRTMMLWLSVRASRDQAINS